MQGLLFWLFQGASKSVQVPFRSSYGTDFDISEIASPVESRLLCQVPITCSSSESIVVIESRGRPSVLVGTPGAFVRELVPDLWGTFGA